MGAVKIRQATLSPPKCDKCGRRTLFHDSTQQGSRLFMRWVCPSCRDRLIVLGVRRDSLAEAR